MTASEITRHALSWLRIRQHQGTLSEEERRGITGLAEFLIAVEESGLISDDNKPRTSVEASAG